MTGIVTSSGSMPSSWLSPIRDNDLPAVRLHGCHEADERRKLHRGVAGGNDNLTCAQLTPGRTQREFAGVVGDVLDLVAGKVAHATVEKRRLQGLVKAQRIAMAIERAETTADNVASQPWQARLQSLAVDDLRLVCDDARLVVQPLQL
jgi:hypothetical protein